MLHADTKLSARLEGLCAAEMRRFVETARGLDASSGAGFLEVAGGIAAFVGADSPVNSAYGMALDGRFTDEDACSLETFFTSRGASPLAGVSPLAHPSLSEVLTRRGWTLDGFENLLVRPFSAGEVFEPPADGIEIVEAVTEEERDVWALVAATGFSDPLPPLQTQLALGRIVIARPGTRLFTAFVDGRAAGTGELYIEGGVAWLSADTTLPLFRGRGVQQALQRRRLALGAAAGCDLAASEAAPGSGSQRNMERAGFRVAYTRVDLVLTDIART